MKHIIITTIFYLGLICQLIAQSRTVGNINYTEDVSMGYTLISSHHSSDTYLIDNCGNVVHKWTSEFFPGNTARLLKNGNLLRATKTQSINFNAGGAGGRIEIVDWDGNLIWEFVYDTEEFRHHHDVLELPNNNILLLAWDSRSKEEAIAAGRNPDNLGEVKEDVWGEHLLEIKPIGSSGYEIVWQWYLWDHLIQDFDASKENYGIVSEHPELVNLNYDVVPGNPDWIHANGIEYNSVLDQIVISSRNFNEFWVIDHSTSIEEAAGHTGGIYGKGGDILYRYGNPQTYNRGSELNQTLFGQHNAQWLEESDPSKFLVFNNGNGRSPEFSSIDIIHSPLTSEGNYFIDQDLAFSPLQPDSVISSESIDGFNYSSFISGVQKLSNGNLLVCAGANGTLIEINDKGESAWTYINPITSQGIAEQGFDTEKLGVSNLMFRAYKYPINYQGFEGKELISTVPIESNPLPALCETITSLTFTSKKDLTLFPNPTINGLVNISGAKNDLLSIEVTDLLGNIVLTQSMLDKGTFIDVGELNSGVYVFHIQTRNFIQSERVMIIN